jgi:hypothetical protein
LAQLIVSESPWLTPVLSMVVDERRAGLVTASVRFLIPPDVGVQIPTVSVNGTPQDGLEHRRVAEPQGRGKIYQLTEITTELLPGKIAYGVNVRWKTEVVPQYRSTTKTPYTTELWGRSFEPPLGGLTIQLFRTLTDPHQVMKSPSVGQVDSFHSHPPQPPQPPDNEVLTSLSSDEQRVRFSDSVSAAGSEDLESAKACV